MNPNTNEKLDRFIHLLEEIFELDKADLDFGIYRILNLRKNEVKRFLSEGLPSKVREALAPFAADTTAITKRIAEIEKQAADLGIQIAASPKLAEEYARLKSQLAAGMDLSSLETDVYSSLYSFFNRYYDEGDFISKRRYKEGVYAIPYEGEEVKLYWANSDQYYIKTTENFRDYTFIDQGKKVHFRLVDATTEKNNNKEADDKKRVFMLYTESPERPEIKTVEEVSGESGAKELVIHFVYDIPADKRSADQYKEDNLKAIYSAIHSDFQDWNHLTRNIAANTKKDLITPLSKHLNAYVSKNTFDYFIHKDLRGFLTRELDFFIKTEVIYLDDIDTPDEKRVDSYLAKVRAIKRVGKIIIDFLAQIEDFQKKLWLKKKFVVGTNWCITLDRIDEAFYPEILANQAQIAEWKDLYAIDEIQGDLATVGYSEPLTVAFLRQNKNLVLDTRHFTDAFKDRLIASIDNLDEETGGLMIHSENFQALEFLSEKYHERIECVYIDPPYNTDASSILYKNNYKDSAWLSLLYDRIVLARSIMAKDSIFCAAIDDEEVCGLRSILDLLFEKQVGIAAVRSNPAGRKTKGKFAPSHEYALFYGNGAGAIPSALDKEDHTIKRFPLVDSIGHFAWANLIRSGTGDKKEDRPTLHFPIYVEHDDTMRIPEMNYNEEKREYEILEEPADNEVAVWPIVEKQGQKIYKRWQRGQDRISKEPSEYRIRRDRNTGTISIDFKTRMDDDSLPTTWWDDKRYASANYGAAELKTFFGVKPFDFAKAAKLVEDCIAVCGTEQGAIILDFFAGSGTTGEAVININRQDEDGGNRKYILVEMGDYFHKVTLPRMKKVVYSDDWKDGKPQKRNTGVSHILKYISLESYEDALSNIDLDDQKHQVAMQFGDEYLVQYMLDYEADGSMLSLADFTSPFAYHMNIIENNETKDRRVDLCETFNYLIGLTVIRQTAVAYFCAIPDEQDTYEGAVRLEKDDRGTYGFKQIIGTLPDGKCAIVIWRTMTKDLRESNAALDAYFAKHRINPADREFDVIYVNGDSNLENLRLDDETWKVQRIEPIFKEKMFEEAE